jgi:hypothetical protein
MFAAVVKAMGIVVVTVRGRNVPVAPEGDLLSPRVSEAELDR